MKQQFEYLHELIWSQELLVTWIWRSSVSTWFPWRRLLVWFLPQIWFLWLELFLRHIKSFRFWGERRVPFMHCECKCTANMESMKQTSVRALEAKLRSRPYIFTGGFSLLVWVTLPSSFKDMQWNVITINH